MIECFLVPDGDQTSPHSQVESKMLTSILVFPTKAQAGGRRMKPARKFAKVSRRFYRPEQSHCPVCQRRLRRGGALSGGAGVTLGEVIQNVPPGGPRPH